MHRAAFRAGDRIVVKIVELCAARGAEAFRAELGFRHGQKSLRGRKQTSPWWFARANSADPWKPRPIRRNWIAAIVGKPCGMWVGASRIASPPGRSAAKNSGPPLPVLSAANHLEIIELMKPAKIVMSCQRPNIGRRVTR